MSTGRYAIRRIGWDARELTEDVSFANGDPIEPYGIWDRREKCWVNQFGDPDAEYWATCREVALMRRRELSEAARSA